MVGWIGRIASALLCALSLSACIAPKSYVDTALGPVSMADIKRPAAPQPVQLLVEFKTKGAVNQRATDLVKPKILEQVSQSKVFSEVSYSAVASGRVLSVSIENVALTDNAAAKGFGVGLTFGLVGTMVTDGYVCSAAYAEPGKTPIVKEVKHALHTTIGNAEGPKGVAAMAPKDAIDIVLSQMVGHALKLISADPAFAR